MPAPTTIQIVAPAQHDSAVIWAARIGLIAAIISLVAALGSLLGAFMTMAVGSAQIAVDSSWKHFARANGWIPQSECQWESIDVPGRDKSGKEAAVRIHLLAGEYRWVLGSSNNIQLGEDDADLDTHIRGLELDPDADVVVAVGMASVEGTFPEQSVLAEERTDRLISSIKHELKPDIPVHGLSIGRYIDEKTKSTSRATAVQRRVVVVEVFEKQPNVMYEEAVYDALIAARKASPPIPFDVRDYKDRSYTNHSFGRK
jgi:hypothetical protein